jgi:hypothetical protein
VALFGKLDRQEDRKTDRKTDQIASANHRAGRSTESNRIPSVIFFESPNNLANRRINIAKKSCELIFVSNPPPFVDPSYISSVLLARRQFNPAMSTSNDNNREEQHALNNKDDVDDDADDDAEQLAAVLSACQSEVSSMMASPTNYNKNNEDDCTSSIGTEVVTNASPEVLYQDGATALFCALEECQWENALDILDDSKRGEKQLRTWVKTKQQEHQTAFTWSLWRRLPIHEVSACGACCTVDWTCLCYESTTSNKKSVAQRDIFCTFVLFMLQAARRQAPAWLVAKMLSLYPESATQVTQFGELPLHLAVETGCVLEVVNLLLVSYFRGISDKDNSGRTPLDIATDNELGDKLVLECLQRAFKAHACMVANQEKAVKQLKQEHKLAIQYLKSQQDIQLQAERERQASLEGSFTKIQQHVQTSEEARQKMKQQMSIHKMARDECEQKMEKLCRQIVMLQDEMATEQQINKDLLEELSDKEDEIQRLRMAVKTLSEDLSHVMLEQHQTIAQQVVQTEKDMKTFLISQQMLKAQLVSQAKQMQMLLKERGIEMPVSLKKKGGEEKKESVEEIDSQQAVDAAAQAAFAALQHADKQV